MRGRVFQRNISKNLDILTGKESERSKPGGYYSVILCKKCNIVTILLHATGDNVIPFSLEKCNFISHKEPHWSHGNWTILFCIKGYLPAMNLPFVLLNIVFFLASCFVSSEAKYTIVYALPNTISTLLKIPTIHREIKTTVLFKYLILSRLFPFFIIIPFSKFNVTSVQGIN